MAAQRCGLLLPQPHIDEIGQAIAESLAENGCQVVLAFPQAAWEVERCDLLLSYGPMGSMAGMIARLIQMPAAPPLVVWFTEQVPLPSGISALQALAARLRCAGEAHWLTSAGPHARLLGRLSRRAGRLRALGEMLFLQQCGLLRLLGVFSQTNQQFLARHKLPLALIPMGYHPRLGQLLDMERDLDVVFLGSTRDRRRRRIIGGLETELARRGISFVVKDGSPAHGYVFGHERTVLLNRAKIMLNVMRQRWDDPVFRLLLAGANGTMLLSEPLWPTSTGPFSPGEHLVATSLPEMVDTIEFYLSHPDKRQRIAANAHTYLTSQLTMDAMVGRLLRAVEEPPHADTP